MERPYFPMFIDISGKKILVVGGGSIALRRVRTLLKFGADIKVIAPELKEELTELETQGKITAERRCYGAGDTEGYEIVLAASDRPDVNRAVKNECSERGIPVNTADDKSLCDFYFPSVVMTETAVIGISSGGEDPSRAKELRKKIQEFLHKYK